MTFAELHPALRGLVGPEADHVLLDRALRFCGGKTWTYPGAYGLTGKATSPEHFCTISAEAYGFCAKASPAGGVARCLTCGIPILIPPETCIERLRPLDAEMVVDIASGRSTF